MNKEFWCKKGGFFHISTEPESNPLWSRRKKVELFFFNLLICYLLFKTEGLWRNGWCMLFPQKVKKPLWGHISVNILSKLIPLLYQRNIPQIAYQSIQQNEFIFLAADKMTLSSEFLGYMKKPLFFKTLILGPLALLIIIRILSK